VDVDFAFVCDYAESGNKISALGIGFDTIYAPQVPCVHPNFHLVAQIRASKAEVGDKEITIRLIDADGKDVVPVLNGTLNIPPPAAGSIESTGRLVVGFAGVKFPKYSQYTLHVAVQGHEMVRIHLRVARPPRTG